MLTKPTAILFDMGGVLQDAGDRYNAETFPEAFPHGLPEPAPLDWFLGMSTACLDRFLAIPPPRPTMDCRPMIAEWLRRRDVVPTDDVVERWLGIMEQWEARPVYPHVPPTLRALRDMGIHMGVVSNTMTAADYIREHFRKAAILGYFEVTVFSAEFGVNKPDPAIFKHALDAMDVVAEQAWYVGDKPQRDVLGAHGVGMTALLVDSAHVHHVNDGPEYVPNLRIQDISALPKILRDVAETE